MVQIFTAQKIKFSIKGFFSKCDQIRRKLVTFTEEIFNGKLHFLCSDCKKYYFHFSTHKQLRKVKEVYQKI